LRDAPAWLNASEITGLVETAEVALDPARLRGRLVSWLGEAEDVSMHFGTRIESAERTAAGFRASGTAASGEVWRQEADILVELLVDGRLKLDESLGRSARALVGLPAEVPGDVRTSGAHRGISIR
jgi:hypothetical protein